MAERYIYGTQEKDRGNIDLINDDITALLVTSEYVPDFDNDQAQSDIPEAAQAVEVSLVGKTFDVNKYLADDLLINTIPTGTEIAGIVILKNTGNYDDSTLIQYMDGPEYPFTTDGSPLTIQWDRSVGGTGILITETVV